MDWLNRLQIRLVKNEVNRAPPATPQITHLSEEYPTHYIITRVLCVSAVRSVSWKHYWKILMSYRKNKAGKIGNLGNECNMESMRYWGYYLVWCKFYGVTLKYWRLWDAPRGWFGAIERRFDLLLVPWRVFRLFCVLLDFIFVLKNIR